MKPLVAVAMSGGVDSSVAAALLLERGFEVIGVTMCLLRGWESEPQARGCCSLESIEDAKRVAAKLKIRHVVLQMQDQFQKAVVDDFVEEYRNGRTPNPCVRCNQFIKFDVLLNWALSIGAQYIATGHYARVEHDTKRGKWLLKRGLDRGKDQSYALYRLTQDQLARTIFPLGEMTKDESRNRAAELGLTVADKPDSQEVCFVSNNDYGEFLETVAPDIVKPGDIVDSTGRILGKHKGIAFFTVGQRKRLGISVGSPRYVLQVDPIKNRIVVGPDEQLWGRRVVAGDLNFISIDRLRGELVVTGKIRYNTKDSEAIVRPLSDDLVEIVFAKPQRAITPGQSIVLYQDEEVVGGGAILRQDMEGIADA